jgi:hypothetical protein
MKRYDVTLKYSLDPAPFRYEIEAASKREAITKARRQSENDGNYGFGAGRGLGRATWTAVEAR